MQKQNHNLSEQCMTRYQYSILNSSTNARLIIIEYMALNSQIQEKQKQITNNGPKVYIIKLINLQGNFWPEYPLSFQRKNCKTIHQVVRYNKQKFPVDLFIKHSLQNVVQLLEIIRKQKINNIIQAQNDPISQRDIKQVYISNYGNRITFLIEENTLNYKYFIENQNIKKILKTNEFESNLNVPKQQLIKSQMQYGSQSFVNFVQRNSLYSVLQLFCLKNQNQLPISQFLHSVASLLNFNHKFFHPPKDATRFLKKTCGINIYGRKLIVQKKSQMRPEEIFLRCLFQIPPTKTLANILGHPEGPLYLQKYSFSQNFVPKIEQVYYLKGIQTYFHKQNQRNFSYATFYSRINPEYLQSKNGKYWLNIQRQKQIEFEQGENDSQDSQDSQQEGNKNQQQTDQYRKSYKQFVKTLKKQQQSRKEQKSQKVYSKFFTNEGDESEAALQVSQLYQFHNFVLQISLQICPKCMITLRNISFQQNTIQELYNMIHYGNQKYCLQCGDLFKEIIKNTKKNANNNANVEIKKEIQQSSIMKAKQQVQTQELSKTQQVQKQSKKQQVTTEKDQNKNSSSACKADLMVKKQRKYDQSIQGKMYERFNQNHQQNQKKKVSQRQVFLFQNYLPFLALNLRQMIIINPDLLHDSFQLSKIRGFLNQFTQQNSSQREGLFCDIISVYLNNSISKLLIVGNQTKHYQISNLMNLKKQLKRKKYEIIQKNIIRKTIFEQFGDYSNISNEIIKSQKKKEIQNIPMVFDSIYKIVQTQLAIANSKISQHYRTYQQDMKKQYKITVEDLKILIQKIKADLKDKIIKTSEEFIKNIKWITIFITELVEQKAATIIKQSLKPTDFYLSLNFFTYQVQALMNILTIIITSCNQPGQAKIMQGCQSLICEAIALIIDKQNQIAVMRQEYIKMNQKQILKDMMEHFYYKKIGLIQKQEAKKLIQYHYDKFKAIFNQKLNAIVMGSKEAYAKLQENYKNIQLKILHSTIKVTDQILFSINQDTLFSSYIFLDEYYLKFQASVVQNLEIRTFLNLIRSTTNLTWKQDSINIKSYPQKQDEKHQPQIIKISTIYKIICDSLQKIQTLDELIKGFRSSNKRLFNLISFLISQCYNFQNIQFGQIYHRAKLHLSRQMFYAQRKQHLDKHKQTLQILKFLWENRNKFLPYPNAQQPISYFIKQYHFVICIVILNMMPLFNIQAMYKIQMKNLGKSLKMFTQNENYTQVEDYLIKVLRVRHNAAKSKRKEEIASKQEGNKQKQED